MKKTGSGSVEKAQVTFATRASGLTGPVGYPILVVSIVLDRDVRQLVTYVGNFGGVAEDARLDLPRVPLDAHHLEIVGAYCDAALQRALERAVGIQLELLGQDP